ncbi:MAG: DUF2383 domain-containing protein [Lysobacteraceae bacterium]
MSESLNILPELIEASREGVDFYAEAADSVRDSELSKLFRKMALAKTALANELTQEVEAKAAPVKKTAASKRKNASEWVSQLNTTYTSLRSGLPAMKPDQMTQIEQTEADLLGRVQRLRHDRAHSYVVRVLAMQYEAQARAVHEGLRARKRNLSKA